LRSLRVIKHEILRLAFEATTAEGVETIEQAQLLEAEGCTEIQGYLISRPMPVEELEKFSKKHTHVSTT